MREILKWFADEAAGRQQVEEVLNKLPRGDSAVAKENAINVLLYAAGLVAVVMIIYAGLKITTSAGDAGKVAKGKQTLTYAIIGLIIVVLAYAIVNFVVKAI